MDDEDDDILAEERTQEAAEFGWFNDLFVFDTGNYKSIILSDYSYFSPCLFVPMLIKLDTVEVCCIQPGNVHGGIYHGPNNIKGNR